ncbi:cuticle protein AM1159-like [Macrobrachium nipponense]|uniref:cuticle protein AM1159-like n=1 Tax=Macrobrachium nipponense TaxID=159736 RepID=UPI0030C7C7FF
MKCIIFACVLALAFAAPQQFQDPVAITRDERVDNADGSFQYIFEAENGISAQAVGVPGVEGQSNIEGSYSFPLPDGSGIAEVRYVADENGFRAESPLLPVAPPAPAHVEELLRIADEQRAAGITFE